jgi:hypothetical protein
MAPTPERAPAGAARFREALILSGLLSVLVVLFYAVLFPRKGIRVPAWSDAQTYIWWTRRAATLGLRAYGTGTRPATVGFLAAVSTLAHVPAEAVAWVIGLVLAAAMGLAGAALSESALGPHRIRFVLVAVLTGTFVSQLVSSFFATLAFAAMFLAGLVYFSEGLRERRAMSFATAGVLLGAAALAHPVFGGLESILLLGGLVVLGLQPRRSSGGDGQGSAKGTVGWAGVAVALAIGAIVLGLGLLVARSASGPPLDQSADAVQRRLGIDSLLLKSYRDTLSAYLPIFLPTVAAALLALVLVPKRSWASAPARQRMLVGVGAAWVAVTFAAIPLLLMGLPIPAQRLVALCLPLPFLIAVGMANGPGPGRSRLAGIAAMAVLVAGMAFLVPRYWKAWESQKGNRPRAVADARTLGSVLARQPEETPLILVANDVRDEPSFFTITRLASILRDGVPPARVRDVYVFVGSAQDFLAGRPTLAGEAARDRMARDYWQRIRRVLDRPALAVAVGSFDPLAYQNALRIAGHTTVAPGIVALPGFTGAPSASPPASLALTMEGARPLSPWLPVWLGPLLVLALGAVGWPWVTGTLPGANPRIRAGLAPVAGMAAISLGAVFADALGLRLDGWGAYVALFLAVGPWLLIVVAFRRRRRRARPADRTRDVESSVGSYLGA